MDTAEGKGLHSAWAVVSRVLYCGSITHILKMKQAFLTDLTTFGCQISVLDLTKERRGCSINPKLCYLKNYFKTPLEHFETPPYDIKFIRKSLMESWPFVPWTTPSCIITPCSSCWLNPTVNHAAPRSSTHSTAGTCQVCQTPAQGACFHLNDAFHN